MADVIRQFATMRFPTKKTDPDNKNGGLKGPPPSKTDVDLLVVKTLRCGIYTRTTPGKQICLR